jgi:hypothetical protein
MRFFFFAFVRLRSIARAPPLNLGFAFSACLSAAENRANEGRTNQGSVNFQRLFHTTYWG